MKVKVLFTFRTGSSVFFSKMPDFKPHDIDEICVMDYPLFGDKIAEIRKDGKDLFFIFNYGKDKLIEQCNNINVPMAIAKFLSPEFAKYLDLNIDDLKKLKDLSERMDDKHYYLKMIFDYYIQNNGFYLTKEQRENAYKEYKSKRS